MKKYYYLLLTTVLILIFSALHAQQSIGGVVPTKPHYYSVLELISQYRSGMYGGLRLPQMTTAQRDGLIIPILSGGARDSAQGLAIFNLDIKCVEYWNDTKWISLCDKASDGAAGTEWYLNGTSTDAASNKTDPITRSGAVNITAGDGALNLYASNSNDFTNMQFYARTATPTVRSGFIGYMNTANTRLDIGNEIGNVIIQPGNIGNVGIGTITPTAKLSVNGSANNTTGSWSVYSDARIKTIDGTFTDGLKVINKIQPVKFHYNEAAPYPTKTAQIGVIAQELEQLAPYMVTKNDYKGDEKTGAKPIKDLREVDNQAYIFLLINAVKEQQAQIETQKTQIDEQHTRIDKLQLQLKQQQDAINILMNDRKTLTR